MLSDPTGAGSRAWEALEVCSCDLVPPGVPGHAYNEAAFRYLLAFEVTSIVLLVAAVGGVILGSAVPRESRL